jgi:hypothetical protein
MQKNIEEKLEDKSEFAKLITQIINASSKELANKILDNFISQSSYSKKQIEVMNKIKNIVFDKQYINIETSVNNVYNLISNQNHPLSEVYDTLSEKEQDDLLDVFNLIKTIDYNKNNSNNTSYEPSFEELKVAQPKPEYN